MRALLTGFEPYGGQAVNPSALVAERLSGERVGGVEVVARVFPVALQGLLRRIEQTLAEVEPVCVINLGLAPGTPVIRLERVAVNLADFGIPDNTGRQCCDETLVADGAQALFATLPIRAIQRRLLQAGIPAQISDSAGLYLCNATMYGFLHAIAQAGQALPSGFIHLPYLPIQVAGLIAEGGAPSLEPQAGFNSMALEHSLEAARIALAVTTETLRQAGVSA